VAIFPCQDIMAQNTDLIPATWVYITAKSKWSLDSNVHNDIKGHRVYPSPDNRSAAESVICFAQDEGPRPTSLVTVTIS